MIHKQKAGRSVSVVWGYTQYSDCLDTHTMSYMDLSVSHEVANFIDDATRLLQRLKIDGEQLSETEIRILSAQLRQLSIEVKGLNATRSRERKEVA